jgi:hypothetical protein
MGAVFQDRLAYWHKTHTQARHGRDAKEKPAESAQDYSGKGVLFQPHHPRVIFRGGATQQHTATAAAASAALSCTGLSRNSGRNECFPSLELSQSVQAPNANSSSLNGTFTAVATAFQQITTELSGAESEEDRNGYHRNSIKTHEAKWPLEFIGGNMTALARTSSSCKGHTRPPVRESAPHEQTHKCLDSNKNLVLDPRWVLHTKKDWQTDRRS